MSLAALIRSMATAGAPAEAIALAVEAIEAEQQKLVEKRAQATARKRAQREREGQSRDSHATVTRPAGDGDATGSLDKGSPCTPSKTQISHAPLTPHSGRKKPGAPIPADWTPPPISELSEKAREYASKWPAGRYEAEAEGFVAFWLNDCRSRPNWRLTWITWVIRVHGQVMRDVRFTPAASNGSGNRGPMNREELRAGIRFAEDNQDPERAAELKRQLAALTQKPPDPKVARLVTNLGEKLRASAS